MLTNVKTRGTWGEVQLGALLDQVLTPQQFERNVKPRPGSNEIVEFAIRLPGPDDAPGSVVWLPIDAKFPQEDYHRLLDVSESGDPEAVQRAVAALSRTVEAAAAGIQRQVPRPTAYHGLRDPLPSHRGVVRGGRPPAGPPRSPAAAPPRGAGRPDHPLRDPEQPPDGVPHLAIEKRSSEVWTVLSAVKAEFGKFGEVLDKVKKQLDTASRSIDQTGTRSRAIERRLRSVEELPAEDDSTAVLGLPAAAGEVDDGEERPERG